MENQCVLTSQVSGLIQQHRDGWTLREHPGREMVKQAGIPLSHPQSVMIRLHLCKPWQSLQGTLWSLGAGRMLPACPARSDARNAAVQCGGLAALPSHPRVEQCAPLSWLPNPLPASSICKPQGEPQRLCLCTPRHGGCSAPRGPASSPSATGHDHSVSLPTLYLSPLGAPHGKMMPNPFLPGPKAWASLALPPLFQRMGPQKPPRGCWSSASLGGAEHTP